MELERKILPIDQIKIIPIFSETDAALSFVGCYTDNVERRLLDAAEYKLKELNSISNCVNHCLRIGFQLAGELADIRVG